MTETNVVHLREMPKRNPTNGTFELTVRCNLHCKMCLFRHADSENAALRASELTAAEWIDLARERKIGWWITSSLESNIGLNALAQWVASLDTTMPQGLGTGALFTNNLEAPIYLDGDRLKYNPDLTLNRAQIDALDWRE